MGRNHSVPPGNASILTMSSQRYHSAIEPLIFTPVSVHVFTLRWPSFKKSSVMRDPWSDCYLIQVWQVGYRLSSMWKGNYPLMNGWGWWGGGGGTGVEMAGAPQQRRFLHRCGQANKELVVTEEDVAQRWWYIYTCLVSNDLYIMVPRARRKTYTSTYYILLQKLDRFNLLIK